MSECTHDCSTCGESCNDRTAESLIAQANAGSRVKKVIAVVSGKGGVGKSTVTSMLAVEMKRRGYQVGILDADITGPSIPKAFHVQEHPEVQENTLYPVVSKGGVKIMSVNLLLEHESDPVLWRGPILGGAVQQFWTDVAWGDVDYLFVDMPPGTGDVPLTVFQSLPVDCAVVVTSPQELVSMIVGKAVKMLGAMDIPVVGLVENYSYLACPDCGKKIAVFGKSHLDEAAKEYQLPVLARLPIDPAIAAAADEGNIESVDTAAIAAVAAAL